MQKNIVQLKLAEFVRRLFTVIIPVDTTRKDVLNPRFWEHVAKKLAINDRIEIMPEDSSYFMEVIVTNVDRQRVAVSELRYINLAGVETPNNAPDANADSLYEYKYRGSNLKHCIMHKIDGSALKEGCTSKDDAIAWLDKYESAQR